MCTELNIVHFMYMTIFATYFKWYVQLEDLIKNYKKKFFQEMIVEDEAINNKILSFLLSTTIWGFLNVQY